MNANRNVEHPRPSQTIAAAALATVIALSLLWGVATLFQSRGEPLEQLVKAERACAHHTYPSEQRACVQHWIAQHEATRLARR